MDAQDKQKKDILTSWKEIAGYLRCDVRTCQRWEKESKLPVHRFIDSSKSRVFSYKQDLDAWLENRAQSETKNRWRYFFFLSPVAALAFIFIFLIRPHMPGSPHDFSIEGSELVMLNKNSKEIWRFDTGIKNLRDEEYYRNQFQTRRISDYHIGLVYPLFIIRDIDYDNKREALFVIKPIILGESMEQLICFDYRGKIKWSFVPGRAMVFGEKKYSNMYAIKGLDVEDLDQDSLSEILVVSNNIDMFPTQVVVLDHAGRLQREYWHSGRVSYFSCYDLDKDGDKEILLSGCNNEYDRGFLAVLEPDFKSGSSPQTGYYKPKGLFQGIEGQYILLPNTNLNTMPFRRDPAIQIHIIEGEGLSLETVSGLIFEFDFNLELKEIRFADRYEDLHNEAYREGKTDSEFSPQIMAELKTRLFPEVLYYNGEDWISNPLMARNKSSAKEKE